MTEPQNPPGDPAQPPTGGQTEPGTNDDTTPATEPGTEGHSGADDAVGREKGLRRRAQDAEAERDRLGSLVEGYQARDVEAIAAERMTGGDRPFSR